MTELPPVGDFTAVVYAQSRLDALVSRSPFHDTYTKGVSTEGVLREGLVGSQ
jgi:hypothetical protein